MAQPDFFYIAEAEDTCTLVFVNGRFEVSTASISFDPAKVRKNSPCVAYRHDRELRRLHNQLQFIWGEEKQPTEVYRSTDLGRTLRKLEPLPSNNLPVKATCMDGTLLTFESWRSEPYRPPAYYIRRPDAQWTQRPLPAGFQAEGISCTPEGTVYVAGGHLPISNGPTKRRWPQNSPADSSSIEPSCGRATEAIYIDDGVSPVLERPFFTTKSNYCASHFENIDVSDEPKHIETGFGWTVVNDGVSWNLATKSTGADLGKRCRDWPGAVTIYHLGTLRERTTDGGKTWKFTELKPAIMAAWPLDWWPQNLFIYSIDARGPDIVARVCGFTLFGKMKGKPDADDRETWLVFTSNDDGATFVHRNVAYTGRGEVCLVP